MPESSERKPKRPPRERLRSIKDPSSTRQPRRQKERRDREAQLASTPIQCPNDACSNPTIEADGDSLYCINCGTMIEDSMIQAEVTFGETAAGAAVVQGGFVGADQRYSKTMGAAFRRVGGSDSRELTENQGREEVTKQAFALGVSDAIKEKAILIYKLAVLHNFIQGRRIRVVAAVCLYVASRQSGATLLLLDLAEIIHVSVYFLGDTYTALKKQVFIKDDDSDNTAQAQAIRPVEVHKYIDRFARRLDFGKKHRQVCEDALALLKRMDRDWIVSGRTPAGLCGACIILAARMNNFRRTVREVVYVVRVCDITIAKRLMEFNRTRASELSVAQFRSVGERLQDTAEPPAVYQARRREEKVKRKLDQMLGEEGDADEEDAARARSRSPTAASGGGDGTSATGQNPRRVDADGFALPDPPSRSQSAVPSQEAEPPKRKRGRPKQEPPPVITEEELLAEEQIAYEVEQVLENEDFWSSEEMRKELARLGKRWQAYSQAEQTRLAALPRQVPGWDNTARITTVSSEVEIGEDEFADDPEVMNCLLSEAEMQIKERIWVTHNEDWLRQQQAKVLKKTLDEAAGKNNANRASKRGRKKKNKDGEEEDSGPKPTSAAEANARMNEKKGRKAWGYTKAINYDKLNALWGTFDKSSNRSESGGESRTASVAVSRAESVAPSEGGGIDEEQDAAAGALPTPEPTQPQQQKQAEQAEREGTRPPDEDEPMRPDANADEGDDDDDDDEEDDDDDEAAREALHDFGIDEQDMDPQSVYDEDEDVGFDDED